MSADFPNYLQSVCDTYQHWWRLYTLTDVEGSKTAQRQEMPLPFDFGLTVETVQAKQQERGETPENTEQKTERLPVLEGISKYAENHVLLVGRPGSGKSTALARLLLEEAQKARSPLNPPLERGEEELQSKPPFLRGVPQAGGSHFGRLGQIPVLVELRQYRTSVLDLIRQFLRRHKLRLESADIETLLYDGQFLLLVDGVNELPNENARRDLKTFRQNYPHTPMIFTTRDLGVGGDLGIEKKLEMQPLTEEQMQQFVRAYLPEQGEEMLRRLGGRLREFGQTPLLLWMLCELFKQTGNVPPNLGFVFRCFAQSYDGKIKDDVPVSGESRRWWQELLQHLAFTMMQGETPTELRVTIDRREAEAIFEKFLQGKVDYPPSRAKEWLEDLLKHHLIQVVSNEQIEFRHQLLQEYYAAECLLQQLANISDEKLKRDYLNYLKWTEPLALMLALVEKEAQAVRVVKLALEVDLALGARLAGEVKREFQEKTVDLVSRLEIPEELKIRLLGITCSNNAIPALLPVLNYENSHVGWYAANSLAKIGSEAAVSALLPALEHESSDVRRNATYAIGKIGSEAAVFALLPALKHESSDVRHNAAFALGEIGSKTATAALLEALNDENSSVLSEAASALGKIGSEEAVPALLKVLKAQGFWVSESAAYALGEIGSELAVPTLLEAMKNKALWVYERAAYWVGEIGNKPIVLERLEALETENHSFLEAVTWALVKIDSQATVPKLLKVLKHENSLVRANAAYALGNIGNEAVVPALLEAWNDENCWVRVQSTYALGKIGNEAAVTTLLEALKDKDSLVRANAASGLGQIGTQKVLPALLEALKDEDSLVRANAAYALGQNGHEVAFAGLLSLLNDKDPSVRRSAVLELGKIGTEAAVAKLLFALNDEDTWVRAYAAKMLGKIGTEAAITALLLAFKDKNPSVGRGAVKSLEQTRTERCVAGLLFLLTDEESLVRQDAAFTLGKIASSELLFCLTERLKTTVETYLLDTIFAIQERCKFYNHEIFHSPPVEEETKTKSEISKSSTYIFHQPVGNLNTGDVNIHGNQIGIERNQLNNKD